MKTLRSCFRAMTVSIFAFLVIVPVHGQDASQQYHDRLNIVKGNKIALIGDWKPEEISRWRNVLSSSDLLEHDFNLVGRGADYLPVRGRTAFDSAFNAWLRRLSGSTRSRWVAFDASNKVIASGADVPDSKAFGAECDKFGLLSPQKRLRTFIKEHPSHIEAQADLLKEVRRRALLAMPSGVTGDLGDMDDLRTWGVLAMELDKAMALDWVGFDLGFFRPDEDQPERFSPIMKAAFRKHIARIENDLRDFPTNANLWDIWAWMARSLGRPSLFWQGLSPFTFLGGPTCPSPKVAVWLTEEARSKGDWESVIQLAKIGRYFTSYEDQTRNFWLPGGLVKTGRFSPIAGYPEKSSLMPHLDALLKLGRIDEANSLYDEIVRGEIGNTKNLAAVARANKYEELAILWEKGELINKRPYYAAWEFLKGNVRFAVLADQGSPEYNQMQQIIDEVLPVAHLISEYQGGGLDGLGWEGQQFRWALFGGDALFIAQGDKMPTADELKQILKEHGLKSSRELAEEFLKNDPNNIEAIIALGNSILIDGIRATKKAAIKEDELPQDLDNAIWGQAASVWPMVFGRSFALFNLPYIYVDADLPSQTMNRLSKRYLPLLEDALARCPFSENLWSHWLFWHRAGGSERDFESFLQSLEPSPVVPQGMFPPPSIMEEYYAECKKKEQWDKIADLLKEPFDRMTSDRLNEISEKEKSGGEPMPLYPSFGDSVALPLIEALLRGGRRTEADEVFNVLLNAGGSFSNTSGLIELARGLAGERIAREWEAKLLKK